MSDVVDVPPPVPRHPGDSPEVALMKAEAEVAYWKQRCRRHEAHYMRLEESGGSVRGAVERFLIVLQHARPQGTEPKA